MRHQCAGRKLGRNASHRHAMFRNMAVSLVMTLAESEEGGAKVRGRITTTVAKAKELRPFIEKLITLGRKGRQIVLQAEQFASEAERGSDAWEAWRSSEAGKNWVKATAPALALRRRVFAALRSKAAVDIIFGKLAERFESRAGGYTRIVRLAQVRLGDAGEQAIIEFVGEKDRVTSGRRKGPAVEVA
ncbi:MAG: bL17 family ribosomal protein [Planctomycetota bacterium]